jgi:hypothetical protein
MTGVHTGRGIKGLKTDMHRGKIAIKIPRREASKGTNLPHLDLRFLAYRTDKNYFCCLRHCKYAILLWLA